MQKTKITDNVMAFTHREGRSSCGMVYTQEGVVLIDTTARPVDIQACLDLADITPEDICLIFLTHSHSDHTSGIPLFECPVWAHIQTRQRILKRGTERAKKQIPTETFENRREIIIGGVELEMIHRGGHTPGSSILWLPESRVLFAGDLIFEGRYPFLATADVKKLMDVLRWLPSLNAQVIVPGHGILCGNEEVLRQLHYIEETWELTTKHIKLGHSVEEAVKDPAYPLYSQIFYEKLHRWNIRVIYQQITKV